MMGGDQQGPHQAHHAVAVTISLVFLLDIG